MDLQLKNKTAVVTGATAGIGFSIAQVLLQEGATVTIPGRSQDKLDEAAKALNAGPRLRTILCDLATKVGADTLIRELPDVDIVVNNLGIYEAKPFAEITDADWLRLFETNVLSGVRLSRHYLPAMLSRNWGRIIFIASESAIQTPSEMIHYGMTKTAQLSISRGLAELAKGTAVTVNSVLPGPTRSAGIVDFLKSIATNPDAPSQDVEAEFFAKHRSASLLQRLIEPEEVAHLVAYLASPLSSATNGAALKVEGGLLRTIS